MEIQFENKNLIVLEKNQKKVIKLKDVSLKLLGATETERICNKSQLQAMGFIGR